MVEGVETLREQVRFLARIIAAAMVLMFLVVALPWLGRMIEIDLAPLAWSLTAFAIVHAALSLLADRIRDRKRMLWLTYAVPLAGIAFMTVLWHHGGGVGHPSLAMIMALPVIAAAALPRPAFPWHLALYSILVVTLVATLTSPDLSWYVTQLGIPGAGLLRLGGEELLPREPFPGATTTPAAMFLFVVTFALVQLAVAFVASRAARSLRARDELALRLQDADVETLPALALRTTPAAALVVVAPTGQIVQATKRFVQQMLLHNEPVVGRELFDFLDFDDANAVRTLLTDGGTIPSCRYRISAEERVASMSAAVFEHEGTRYASVVITDEDSQ